MNACCHGTVLRPSLHVLAKVVYLPYFQNGVHGNRSLILRRRGGRTYLGRAQLPTVPSVPIISQFHMFWSRLISSVSSSIGIFLTLPFSPCLQYLIA